MHSPFDSEGSHPTKRGPAIRLIVLLGVAQLVAVGALFGAFPALLTSIEAETGWSRVAISGAVTLSVVVSALGGPVAGMIIARGGARRLMVGGALVGGASLASLSLTSSYWLFCILWVLVGLAASANHLDSAFAVLAGELKDRFRLGVTGLTLITGFTTSLFIPVGHLLAEVLGWRGALVALGVGSAIICAAIYQAVVPSRGGIWMLRKASSPDRQSLRSILGTRRFWLLGFGLSGISFVWAALNFHFLPFLLEEGLPEFAALTAIACLGPAQIAMRVVLLTLGRNWPPRIMSWVLGLAIFAMLLSMLGLHLWSQLVVVMVAAYGLAGGLQLVLKATLPAELFTADNYATVNGALVLPNTLSRAFAPVALAAIWQLAGGYAIPLWILCALVAVSITGILLALRVRA